MVGNIFEKWLQDFVSFGNPCIHTYITHCSSTVYVQVAGHFKGENFHELVEVRGRGRERERGGGGGRGEGNVG